MTESGNEDQEASGMVGTAVPPRVSVVIPAFNHEDYISEAIDSVLTQTFTDFELIIINDGSTDDTDARIRAYDDSRIRYTVQENMGAALTINKGMAEARGEYISILNSDDAYAPDRLERLVREFDEDATLDAAVTHLELIDGTGTRISLYEGPATLWSDQSPATSFAKADSLVLHLLAGNFVYTTSNISFRKNVLDRIAGFRDLRYLHDYEFLLRLCYHTKVRVVPEILVKYRIHAQNTIKENQGQSDFEFGVVLASFLLEHDLGGLFPDRDPDETALKFFNSLMTGSASQLLLTVLALGHHGNLGSDFLFSLAESKDSPFRATCVEHFTHYTDTWLSAQEVWAKWREVNDRLIAKDNELCDSLAEAKKTWEESSQTIEELNARCVDLDGKYAASLVETKKIWEELQTLQSAHNQRTSELERVSAERARILNSTSWRVGRAATWPARKVRDWFRKRG